MSNLFSRWASRNMPTREGMAKNKYLAPIAHRFLSPELWRFTRRSVPRGVALGLFAGFIVPVGQIFLAAFLALPTRANVPLAALVTFITNPLTFPFWAVLATKVGRFMLKIDAVTVNASQSTMASGPWAWFTGFFELAGAAAVGFIVMAVVFSSVGYFVTNFVWRFIVANRRKARLRKMEARLDERLKAGK